MKKKIPKWAVPLLSRWPRDKIAKRCGVCSQTVFKWRKKYGVLFANTRENSPLLRSLILECMSRPLTFRSIYTYIRDDYGRISERAVWRHIAYLVKHGQVSYEFYEGNQRMYRRNEP